jgi:MFS family permease
MLKMTEVGRHNARQLYYDVFWFGVTAGSTLAFLPVYAARLGASGLQVALLTAAPAFVNLALSLPAARLLEGRPLFRPTMAALFLHRPVYALFSMLPWLFAPTAEVWALVALVALLSVTGTVINVGFNALFADLVPPEFRGEVVGRRNALMAASMLLTSLACGWLLETIAFPLSYQLVFGLGLLGVVLSTVYLLRLKVSGERPLRVGRPIADWGRPHLLRFADAMRQAPGLRFLLRAKGRSLLRLDLLRGPFGPFMLAYLMFYTFQFTPIPILPLFWVNDLGIGDLTISIGNAIFQSTMFLASLALAPLGAKLGHRRLLVFSALLYGLYPLANSMAQGAGLFLAASVAGGVVWGLASGALATRLFERVPDNDRPAHMALFNLAVNFGMLAGSLLGPALAEWLGLREALMVSAALRLAAGLLLLRWG